MKFLKVFIVLLLIPVIIHLMGGNYVYKAVYHNLARIDNFEIFENRVIEAKNPKDLKQHSSINQATLPAELQHQLDSLETIALLVIQHDSIKFEQYWNGGAEDSKTNSFSMAKSVVSILVGIAVEEGKIKDIHEPIANYIPSFKENGREKITFYHLLTMSSGLGWTESYMMPFSQTTDAYYGNDLHGLVDRLELEKEPGTEYKYKSGDTEALAIALTNAVGMTLSEYASLKLWGPLNAKYDALWSLDKEDGMEKSYCCIISNARDFSRIGSLYLNNGVWDSTQIVPANYVAASIVPTEIPSIEHGGKPCAEYGYSWWLLDYHGESIFYARGILGQFVICIPSKDMVVVKLGHKRGDKEKMAFTEVYDLLDFAYKTY